MQGNRRHFVMLGMLLISVSTCLTMFVGNISTYIYSIHYTRGNLDAFDIDVSWLLPVYLVCRFIATFVVDRSAKTIGMRMTSGIGMILSWLSVFLSYFTVSHSVWALTTTLTFIGGIGNGMLSIGNFVYVAGWFKDRAAFGTSMLMCGCALGGVVVNQIITAYINPNNLSPDAMMGEILYFSQTEVIDRIPMVFMVMGVFTVALQFPGFCLLRDPPINAEPGEKSRLLESSGPLIKEKDSSVHENGVDDYITSEKDTFHKEQNGALAVLDNSYDLHALSLSMREKIRPGHFEAQNADNAECGNGPWNTRQEQTLSLRPLQVLQSQSFYFLGAALFAQSIGILVVETYFKVFGQLWIKDDQFLAFVGSSFSFSTLIAMPPLGFLADKIGIKNILTGQLATSTVSMCLWYFMAAPGKWLYMVWVIVLFISYYNQFVIFPIASLKLFGPKYYAANFGLVQVATLVVCFIGPPFMTSVLQSLGWFWLFFITASMTFASMIPILLRMPAK